MVEGRLEEAKGWLRRSRTTLSAAEYLRSQQYYREAVSRAYYAMFYAARALLLTRGILFHKHSAVIAAFGKEFARHRVIEPRLHRAFIDAFKERNLADYEVVGETLKESVEERLMQAEEFVREVELLISKYEGT